MAFSQTARIWWDATKPGLGTAKLNDADVATTPVADDDSGISNRLTTERWVICARSGFAVPFKETRIDPYTGRRTWARYVDRIHLLDKTGNKPPRTPSEEGNIG